MKFAASAQFLWPLFSAMGYSFQRRLFECRLVESSISGTLSLDSQVHLLESTLVNEGAVTTQRLIVKIERKFQSFLDEGYSNSIYIHPLRGFFRISPEYDDPSPFFTANGMRYMLTNLGLHCGVRIDSILTDHISRSMAQIFLVFSDMRTQLEQCFNEFILSGTIRQDILPMNRMNQATTEMQKLGCSLVLREILRDVMSEVVDSTVPGLRTLIDTASMRKNPNELTPREILVKEVFIGNTTEMPFVRYRLEEMHIPKQKESLLFNFFFGLLFNNPTFNSVKYDSAHDCITCNLHLFPIAIGSILRMSDIFFEDMSSDPTLRATNIKVMFMVLATIVANKRIVANKEKTHNPPLSQNYIDSSLALTVLSNMFPTSIPWVEYGMIETFFPTRSLNHAYSVSSQSLNNNNNNNPNNNNNNNNSTQQTQQH